MEDGVAVFHQAMRPWRREEEGGAAGYEGGRIRSSTDQRTEKADKKHRRRSGGQRGRRY